MENKKVKNTKATLYDNIQFKSKLEVCCYKKLVEANLPALYEPEKFKLFEGLWLDTVTLYAPFKLRNVGNVYRPVTRKIMDITYTPDFIIKDYKGYDIYFDTKGMPNETYPIKKKLFLKILEAQNKPVIFFEPHNISQINESIKIILAL